MSFIDINKTHEDTLYLLKRGTGSITILERVTKGDLRTGGLLETRLVRCRR